MAQRPRSAATGGCQVCGVRPVCNGDVLCAGCSGTVQLSWGVAHARGPQRGEGVRWAGRRRTVETITLRTDAL